MSRATTKPISPATPKSFDDADHYQREIRQLVPGYEALHALVPAVLTAALPAKAARVLVVGCGPGHEVIALARQLPWCLFDAIDPSVGMVSAAIEHVADASLDARVRVLQASLDELIVERPYDAVVCLLVGHVIPDDGGRARFLAGIADALAPGGVAVLAELGDDGAPRALLTRAHLQWASAAGVSGERLELMERRLGGGFHLLPRGRFDGLCAAAGLRHRADFFRALGVFGVVVEKS